MNLTQEQFEEACRDYEHGYTMAAEYVCNGGEYSADEMYLMYEDELGKVFDLESKYVTFGIVDFLADLEAMTDPANVHSVRLS